MLFRSVSSLGRDFSGNSNNWTTNNISTTSGSTYDSMVDVPTQWMPYNTAGDVGGVVRGNYAVLNPLSKNSSATIVDGNLTYTGSYFDAASMFVTTGKFYVETTVSSAFFASYGGGLGIVTGNTSFPISISPGISGQEIGRAHV